MSIEILKRGVWLYDGSVEKSVDIISLSYDWWYSMAEADGMLEVGEEPESLNARGTLYYVRFQRAGETEEPTWVDSQGFKKWMTLSHWQNLRLPVVSDGKHIRNFELLR